MLNWLKSLFSRKRQYVYGIDFGSTDKSMITKGYFDKDGKLHIVEVKEV